MINRLLDYAERHAWIVTVAAANLGFGIGKAFQGHWWRVAAVTRRQPLAARVWGRNYRWWWCDCPRHKKKAKRRSARRERRAAKEEISSETV